MLEALACAPRDRRTHAAIVEAALVRSAKAVASPSDALSAVLRAPEHDEMSIAAIARELGVSGRHLHRLFTRLVGVSPKTYAKVRRLRRAMQVALGAPTKRWTEIAHAVGYFDQSHMIADFRRLTRTTPSMLRRELAPP